MRFVLAQRPKWVKNARAWSIAAKLSAKAINTYLDRADVNAKSDMQSDAVVRLAHAARVSVAWFVAGEGSPRGIIDSRNPVDEYVRARLRELRRQGLTLKQVSEQLGIEIRTIRSVWGGRPVLEQHVERFALALGLGSVEAMRGAAAEWWRTRGEDLYVALDPKTDPDPVRAEANADARGYHATDQSILSTLETQMTPTDAEGWTARFLADASRFVDTSDAHDRRVLQPARKMVKQKQAILREGHERRRKPKVKLKPTPGTGTHG